MKCYGVLELAVTSPAQSFCEPLTLAEVKSFLGLPTERSPADTEEDALLEGFIIGAREVAETMQNRDLVEKQYNLTLDYFPCEIQLRTPLVSVDLVQYTDSDGTTHTVDPADYLVDTARGILMSAYLKPWPSFTARPSSAVKVTFTSGLATDAPFWSDGGQRVLIGMKQLISNWFNERLPFEIAPGSQVAVELPFTVTWNLSAGSVPRAF